MKVIILAAGYGTRLGELTKNKPKPIIEIAGKPIIAYIIERLHLHGITEIIVNIHYLPAEIYNYLGGHVLYSYEQKLLGHRGTILSLRNWLKDDNFFVINGDTLTDLNYSEMIAQYKDGSIMVAMDEWRAIGSWIYSKEYFSNENLPVVPYRPSDLHWFDTGTPQRLEDARRYFENDSTSSS